MGVEFACLVSSCTGALMCAYAALGMGFPIRPTGGESMSTVEGVYNLRMECVLTYGRSALAQVFDSAAARDLG